jgi:transcriptional regulator with XRE-family HTH domain
LLKAAIIKGGKSRADVAKTLGISLTSLSKKINNKVEFKASEIYKLSAALQIENKDDIFFAQSVDLK